MVTELRRPDAAGLVPQRRPLPLGPPRAHRAGHGERAAPRRRAAAVGRLRPGSSGCGTCARLGRSSASKPRGLGPEPAGHARRHARLGPGRTAGRSSRWDLTSLELVAQLPLHQGPVMSVDFRADVGLLSGSADKTVALLSAPPYDERLTTGEEIVVEDGAVDLGIPGLTDAVAGGARWLLHRSSAPGRSAMERTVAVKADPRHGGRPGRRRALPAQVRHRPAVPAPGHRPGLRRRHDRGRAALPDHAVLRARLPRSAADEPGALSEGSPSGWPAPSPTRSSTSISTGSSTATSSRPTSCSPSSTSRCWPTSGWPGWSTGRSLSARRAPTWSL